MGLLKFSEFSIAINIDSVPEEDLVQYYTDFLAKTDVLPDIESLKAEIVEDFSTNLSYAADEFEDWVDDRSLASWYGLQLAYILEFHDMLQASEINVTNLTSYKDLEKLNYSISDLNPREFEKIKEDKFDSYYITEYYTGHGWVFSDGSMLSQAGVDHRSVADFYDWYDKRIVTLISISDELNIRLLTNMTSKQAVAINELIEELQPSLIRYDVHGAGMDLKESNEISFFDFDSVYSLV